MALPGALMLASMMLTTSAAWLEVSVARTRLAASVDEHLRATQAADSALELCADALFAGMAPVRPAFPGVPTWAQAGVFDDPSVYEPAPSWPGSARPPQCVIDEAHVEGRPDARVYTIAARGFGRAQSAQAWLELAIWHEPHVQRRAWRRIVNAPALE